MDVNLKNKLKSVIDKILNEGSSSSNITNTNVAGAFSNGEKKGGVTIVTQKTIASSPNSVATSKAVSKNNNDYESTSDEADDDDDDDLKSKSKSYNKVKLYENEMAGSPKILPDPTKDSSAEYNVNFDFTDFENKINAAEEGAKEQFQEKLKQKVSNKKVLVRASKGQPGQPEKDYTINVSGVSVDYYYDRYVVVFKDEKDKEYFLKPGYKVKLLGQAEVKPTHKAPARINPPMPVVSPPQAKPVAPAQAASPIQKPA